MKIKATRPLRHITQYEGPYGERTTRRDAEYLFSELLETRSRHFDWDIKPHIHTHLYQLFFVERGAFVLYEASGQRQLQGPCLLLIPPAALHGFTFNAEISGRVLTMSDTLLEPVISGLETLTPMLAGAQCLTAFSDASSPQRLKTLIEVIDEELFSNRAEKRTMLQACLQQLLLVIYRLWQHNKAVSTESDTISLAYFRKFQQRIRQAGTTHTITQLAGELGITPVHLNRICREVAGRSAGQLVQQFLLEEAHKYLTYTSYSVSEIAYLLNFEYPNYFARFFRKHMGLSPKQFRGDKKK